MSLNIQNRYKEDTLSSEMSQEFVSDRYNDQHIESSNMNAESLPSKKNQEGNSFQESEIIEFQYDREDPDLIVNLASFIPDEQNFKEDKKNSILENEKIEFKLCCFIFNDTEVDMSCKLF